MLNILSDFINVVNYDTDKGWSNIFSKLKVNNATLKDTQEFVSYIERLGSIGDRDINNIAKACGNVSTSAIQAANDLKAGRITLEQFKASAVSAASSTSKFSATLKSVAANMAIMLAINLAIKGIAWAIDEFIVTSAELAEKATSSAEEFNRLTRESASLNTELKTTNDRIKELESKPSLSFIEQEELQKLRDATEELRKQIELNKTLANVSQEKARDSAIDFLNSKSSYEQYGEWDMSQVNSGNAHYGQQITSIFSGNQLEVAKQQLLDYEDLLQRKADVENRIQEFQLANPDEEKYTLEQKDVYNNLALELQSYENSIKVLGDTLYDTVPKLDQFKDSLNPDYDQSFIDTINDITHLYSSVFGNGAQDATKSFNEVWESATFSSTRKELEKLSKAGELTPNVLKSNEEYKELLEATGKTADELTQHINSLVEAEGRIENSTTTPFSKSEMISAINGMSEGFEELDKIYASISDKNPFDFKLLDDKAFKDNFSNLTEEYGAFVQTVSESPNNIAACKNAFNDLVTAFLNQKIVTKELNENTKELAISQLELYGVTNASAVVNDAILKAKAEEIATSKELSSTTYQEIQAIAEEAGMTDEAKQSFYAYTAQKLLDEVINTNGDIMALANVMNALGLATDAWRKYYAAKREMDAINSGEKKTYANGDVYYEYKKWDSERKQYVNTIVSEEAYNQKQNDIDKYSSNVKEDIEKQAKSVTAEYSGGNKSNSPSGGSKSKSPKENSDIDWIDRAIQLSEQKKKELDSALADTYTPYTGLSNGEIQRASELLTNNLLSPGSEEFQEFCNMAEKAGLSVTDFIDRIQSGENLKNKQSILEEYMAITQQDIADYKKYAEQYEQSYENLVALVPEYRDKIENGGDEIELVTGEKKTQIDNAKNAYEKQREMREKLKEAEENYQKLRSDWHDASITQSKMEIAQLEKQQSVIEAQMKYLEAAGHIVSASLYEDNIDNIERQRSKTEKMLQKMKDKFSGLDPEKNTEEYYNLQNAIDECEVSITNLDTAAQEAYNSLLQLPIKNQEIIVGMTNDIISSIQNYGSEVQASGKKLDSEYYQTLINNGMTVIEQYEKEAELIQEVMGEYDKGSNQWNSLYKQLTEIGSSISTMTKNLHEWNEELLKMPLNSINTFTDELNKVLDALNNIQSDHNTVISAVTKVISDYKESLQKANEATNDEYEAVIEDLNDRLDLLKEQNEQLKLQAAYEQALYDLQTANTQKTEKVIREGQIVYETNADNLREAQESVQDALTDLKENELQTEIDDLQDALEDINDAYEKQVKTLEKISEKWEKIASNTEAAANNALATEYLGKGWENKVLTGNDNDIYTAFKGDYESNYKLIKSYEEQINSTKNIYSLLENYITSYKEGTLTYEQSLNGIQSILSQMNKEMSTGQNLQNVLDYLSLTNNSDATANEVLKGIQNSLSNSSDEMLENMKQYNDNLALISDCMTSWEQLVDNTNKMVEILEDVRDNLEDTLDELGRRAYEEDDEEDDTHYTTNGGTAPRHDKDDWGSSSKGPGMGLSYDNGIENGLVGRSSSPAKRETVMKTIGTRDLNYDEFPALLHLDEAVFNKKQQEVLLNNLRNAYTYPYGLINSLQTSIPNAPQKEQPTQINVEVNGVDVHGVQDVKGFLDSMVSVSGNAIRQQFSKGFD